MMKLKKTFVWIKHYWYFPVMLIVLAATFIMHRKKASMLIDMLVGTMESHKKEVEVIESAEAAKAEKIEKASRDHSRELQDIFSDEADALEKAGKTKEKREKTLQELEMEMLAEEMKKTFKKD